MSRIRVVAQYSEHGLAVLEDDDGRFLLTANGLTIPLQDKQKTPSRVLIAQFVKRRIPAVERAFA